MKFFFYFPLLLVGITYIFNAITKKTGFATYSRLLKRNKKNGVKNAPKVAWNELNENETGSLVWYLGAVITGLLLSLIGLFSFNWGFFILILIWQFLPLHKAGLGRFSRFVSGLLFIFVALNSYHFKIDLLQLIINIF